MGKAAFEDEATIALRVAMREVYRRGTAERAPEEEERRGGQACFIEYCGERVGGDFGIGQDGAGGGSASAPAVAAIIDDDERCAGSVIFAREVVVISGDCAIAVEVDDHGLIGFVAEQAIAEGNVVFDRDAAIAHVGQAAASGYCF